MASRKGSVSPSSCSDPGSVGQKLSPASNAVNSAESLDFPGVGRDINMTSALFCYLASYAKWKFFRSETRTVRASECRVKPKNWGGSVQTLVSPHPLGAPLRFAPSHPTQELSPDADLMTDPVAGCFGSAEQIALSQLKSKFEADMGFIHSLNALRERNDIQVTHDSKK